MLPITPGSIQAGTYGSGPAPTPTGTRDRAASEVVPRLRRVVGQLEVDRKKGYDQRWREVQQYLTPQLGKFDFVHDTDTPRDTSYLLDAAPQLAHRVLAAGLLSGVSSPVRPWFTLALRDPALTRRPQVQAWLHDVQQRMLAIMANTNVYRSLHTAYEEIAAFGTAAIAVVPNFDRVMHFQTMTAGTYALSYTDDDRVDTFTRRLMMTARNMVSEYGIARVSPMVKSLYANNPYHKVPVVHVIERRIEREQGKADAKNKPFASYYYEDSTGALLRESGFDAMPVLAPRWLVRTNETYGHSPAEEALGQAKELHHLHMRQGQAVDYKTMPPLQVPSSYRNRPEARRPGGLMYVDIDDPSQGIRSAWEVSIDLSDIYNGIANSRDQIDRVFYVDLFQMLMNIDKQGMTAREVAERHEEKMLMLGPVLERLHNELLSPLIETAFSIIREANLLPPAPEDLRGQALDVRFTSVMAQAQRLVTTTNNDRFLTTVLQIAQVDPTVVDAVDTEVVLRDYAEALGVDPRIVRAPEALSALREQRAEEKQAMQQAQVAPDMARAAKDVADAQLMSVQAQQENVL